jgi:hypothetical protein
MTFTGKTWSRECRPFRRPRTNFNFSTVRLRKLPTDGWSVTPDRGRVDLQKKWAMKPSRYLPGMTKGPHFNKP